MAHQVLDVKGLNCPLPIPRAKKALKDVAVGATLEVLSTDPRSVPDFEAFCRATGHSLWNRGWRARFTASSSGERPQSPREAKRVLIAPMAPHPSEDALSRLNFRSFP
jgi:tRNA 2-thiouridine synthesizing protein A